MKIINHLTKIIFAAGIILLQSCSSGKNNNENTQEGILKKEFLSNIKTEKSVLSSQEQELFLTGKVEYNPDKVVYYSPLISGVIDRTYFSLGDKVQKEQALLDVRSTEIGEFRANMISFDAEMKIAERELQSVQALFNDKLLSEKELLEAKSALKQAQTAYEKAKSDMSLYIDKGQGVFALKSPLSGYIVDKKAASGTPFSPDSDPLFTVADLSNVWIIANVYAGDLQFVKEGMSVEITTLAYPNEVFSGKINALSQVFDPEEKVLKARIVMPNKDLKFKPKMSVVVKLKNETHRNCLAIPSDALIFDDNKYFVVIEFASEKFEIKEIQIQGHYQKTTYIRSGLSIDDKIVIKNQLLIYSELKGK